MRLKRIWIDNYREFRSTFEDDAEANFVMENLSNSVKTILEKQRSIDFTLCAAYDDEGDALFDLVSIKILPSMEVIINVKYTGTAK